ISASLRTDRYPLSLHDALPISYRDDDGMDTERVSGWLSGSCLLVRWDAFDAIGGFDECYFMYLEDIDLADRMSRAGYLNIFCPDATINHAQGHSTAVHSQKMLRAHHDSAYRFISDRHTNQWHATLCWVSKTGLQVRSRLLSS